MARLQSLRSTIRVLCLLIVPILAIAPAGAADRDLSTVRDWMLLLDNDLEPQTVQAIAASDHDMVVIDDLASMKGYSANRIETIVRALRVKPDGSRRLVVAYLNVGQAEDYRTYWRKGWRIGSPDWILATDPDGWKGNYPVAYWNAAWKEMIAGRKGLLNAIIERGFDGVYLDWIGGFEDDRVIAAAQRDGVDPRQEMVRWVAQLSAAAKTLKPGFQIIGQNATALLADAAYVTALDGVAQEDIWFTGGDGGPEGDCPVPRSPSDVGTRTFVDQLPKSCLRAFRRDRSNAMHFAGESEIVPLLDLARAQNKAVFTVDYALRSSNVAWVAQRSRSLGFVPFVGARSLSDYVPPLPK